MVTVLLTSDLTEIHTFYVRIDIFHGRSFLTEISLYLEVKKNPKRIRHSPKNVAYLEPKNVAYLDSEEKPFSSIFMKSTQIKYFFFIIHLNLKTLNISVSPEKVSENMFTIGQFNHTIDRQEPIPKFKSADCPSYFSKRCIQSAHN